MRNERVARPVEAVLIATALALLSGCRQAGQVDDQGQRISAQADSVRSSLAAADRTARQAPDLAAGGTAPMGPAAMGPAAGADPPLGQPAASPSGPFRAGTNAWFLEQAVLQRTIDEAEEQLWVLTSDEAPDAVKIEAEIRLIARLNAQRRMDFIRAASPAAL